MVKPITSKTSEPIQQARSENLGQLNGRKVSNFVAGANDEFETNIKIVKAAAILTIFLPLIALAGGYTATAGGIFTVGLVGTTYFFFGTHTQI